ncbi:hypothetical protein CE91St19_27800 [Odoribacter laneus]|nr:hypothetical protein CE91St19_27800 [Odoribacter laneus]GKI24345.1 hypothetical protein CE91St20_04820 [Odoribacter laneus]
MKIVKKRHENKREPESHQIAVIALIPLGEKNNFAKEIANNDDKTDTAKSRQRTTVEFK